MRLNSQVRFSHLREIQARVNQLQRLSGVSITGNPTKGSNTLFRSWNGTRNALEGYLSNNYGVPIVLDELSSATFKDTTGLLYSIAEGQGRQRSNIHGEVKSLKNWEPQ